MIGKIIQEKLKHQFFRGMTLMLIFLINTGSLFAQEKTISGNITSNEGVSLPGVNILIKGTLTGTITDLNGDFTIKVPDNKSILEIAYVGYLTEEITVGDQTNIKLALVPNIKEIDQVVVINKGNQQ